MTTPKVDRQELNQFFRKVLIVLAAVSFAIFLWQVRKILILLFVAGILAAGISPAVRRVRVLLRHRFKWRVKRGTAALLVYLPFLTGIVVFLILTLPILLRESQQLAQEMPRLVEEKVHVLLKDWVTLEQLKEMLASGSGELQVMVYIKSIAKVVASIVAVLFMVIYILIDAERLRNVFLLFWPAEKRSDKRKMIRRISRKMSGWLSAQLLLATIIGTATFVGLLLLDVPYALPLALIAAVGETIPIIGPIVGAVPALGVALFQSNWQFWSVLAMAVVIQQVENYLLVPRLMGNKVSISPLGVMIAFLLGGSTLGIIGAVVAVPVAAIVQVVFNEVFVSRRERRQNSDRPGTLNPDPE